MKEKKSTSKSNTKNNSASKSVQKKLSFKETLCREMLEVKTINFSSMETQVDLPYLLKVSGKKDYKQFTEVLNQLSQPHNSIKYHTANLQQAQAQQLLTTLSQLLISSTPLNNQTKITCYNWISELLKLNYRYPKDILLRFNESTNTKEQVQLLEVVGMLDLLIH